MIFYRGGGVMKRSVGVGSIVVVLGVVFGLGVAQVARAADSDRLPSTLTFVTGPMNSGSYARAAAWCDLLQKKLGITVTPEPSAGAVGMMNLIKIGDAELASTETFDAGCAYRGTVEYSRVGKVPIRTLQVGPGSYIGLIARKDSGMKSVANLKGKKVVAFPMHPDAQGITRAYLLANGLDPDKDVSYLPASSSEEALQMVVEKRAQAAAISLAGGKTKEFAVTVGGIFLASAHNEKALSLAKSANPFVYFKLIKAGATCVSEDTYFLYHDTVLLTGTKTSDGVAYTIVKTCIENVEELGAKNKELADWNLEMAVIDSPVPFHNGAIKYYKEKGVWKGKQEAREAELLKLGN